LENLVINIFKMGLKITQILTTTGGASIGANSIIVPVVKFHRAQFVPNDEKGNPVEPERFVEFQLPLNKDLETFQADKNNIIKGELNELPSFWIKSMSQAEYDSLKGNDALLVVQTWLKDHIESLNVTCELIDEMV